MSQPLLFVELPTIVAKLPLYVATTAICGENHAIMQAVTLQHLAVSDFATYSGGCDIWRQRCEIRG